MSGNNVYERGYQHGREQGYREGFEAARDLSRNEQAVMRAQIDGLTRRILDLMPLTLPIVVRQANADDKAEG